MMRIINKKSLIILLILTGVSLITSAAVLGGLEWAFASLGAIVLIGLTGIGAVAMLKALRYSKLSDKMPWLENDISGGRLAEIRIISKSDKRIIMNHIDEIFYTDAGDYKTKTTKIMPISRRDKRAIMQHIHELFPAGSDRNIVMSAEAMPVSRQDKVIIMKHIDELFTIGREFDIERNWLV